MLGKCHEPVPSPASRTYLKKVPLEWPAPGLENPWGAKALAFEPSTFCWEHEPQGARDGCYPFRGESLARSDSWVFRWQVRLRHGIRKWSSAAGEKKPCSLPV